MTEILQNIPRIFLLKHEEFSIETKILQKNILSNLKFRKIFYPNGNFAKIAIEKKIQKISIKTEIKKKKKNKFRKIFYFI